MKINALTCAVSLNRVVLCTRHTIQFSSNVFLPAFGCRYPVALGPWRVVPNMLAVATLEFSYPIHFFVQTKANDFPRFALKLFLRLHYYTSRWSLLRKNFPCKIVRLPMATSSKIIFPRLTAAWMGAPRELLTLDHAQTPRSPE